MEVVVEIHKLRSNQGQIEATMIRIHQIIVRDQHGRPSLHVEVFSLENTDLCDEMMSELEKQKWKPGKHGPYETTKRPTRNCADVVKRLKDEIQGLMKARGRNEVVSSAVLYRKYVRSSHIRPHHDSEFRFHGVIWGEPHHCTGGGRTKLHTQMKQMKQMKRNKHTQTHA
jgi:hypothetical protein